MPTLPKWPEIDDTRPIPTYRYWPDSRTLGKTFIEYWKFCDANRDRVRVLIACEESGIVRNAFNRLSPSFAAMSCDILPSANPYGPHYQGDVAQILKYPWDLVIAHPPCTYLCNSGVCWLHKWPDGTIGWNSVRAAEMVLAARFFNQFRRLRHVPCVAIENPIPHSYAKNMIGPYDQIIQPFQFGHPTRKATCFWLKGLQPLRATRNVKLPDDPAKRNRLHWLSPGPNRAKLRSRTFAGIARAMAWQWGQQAFDEMQHRIRVGKRKG